MFHAIARFIRGFSYAFKGIGKCICSERNMRFHLSSIVLVLYWCCFFQPTAPEFALIVLCFGAVCALEAVNTAAEALCDRIGKEHHPLLGLAKDAAAGGVLLMAIASAACGLIIFLQPPRFMTAVTAIFTSPLWCGILIALVISAFWFVLLCPTMSRNCSDKKE